MDSIHDDFGEEQFRDVLMALAGQINPGSNEDLWAIKDDLMALAKHGTRLGAFKGTRFLHAAYKKAGVTPHYPSP